MKAHPRILHLTRNLPPLVGGMERLNWHMAAELAKQADVRVIGPRGAAVLKPASVTLAEAPLKPLFLFLIIAFFKTLWTALRWRPDVILAGSGLTAPLVWLAGKASGARSAAYLHGLDITVNHGLYRRVWHPVLKRLDCVIVNSTPTQDLALAAGVSSNRVNIVHPGVSLPATPQSAERIEAFKAQHGLHGKKILLSVGRLTTRKGLREFVQRALPTIVQAEPDTVLVVVGEAPRNSLGAGLQTVESIQAQAEQSGVAGHLRFLGVITDAQVLATVYEAADVHVFPVRHIPDDPEGFGMVAIEAAAHGLPTVAFATGGVVDAVREGQSGRLVRPGDYAGLAQAALEVLGDGLEIWQASSRIFAAQFAWPAQGRKLARALQCPEPGAEHVAVNPDPYVRCASDPATADHPHSGVPTGAERMSPSEATARFPAA
ncbi:glycosyltransferase family 4 protein [Xenophilus sp. Marseille-Q4582]|uniref:glycosyltransferase family 4 protein n=1 Tax=Xenophilus sp. Marseille-Q4582 TaxID=2866600 RepID=UPI001CE42650|nr:glycosyltransferase family 4 protein [Xenophilus sp. Marseille-Q4582]